MIPSLAGLVCNTSRRPYILTHRLCVVVAAAVASRLHWFVENPRLGSPHPQRRAKWELENVILPPLRVIGHLSGNTTVLNSFKDIEPFVASALGSVQTFLLGMEWHTIGRDLPEENCAFEKILQCLFEPKSGRVF